MSAITIVGCGPGCWQYASHAAMQAIANADILVGTKRLIEEFGAGKNALVYTSVRATLETIRANSDKNIAVLVTGDPGFFSITTLIIREFCASAISIIPGISSITYAFDRLGIPWHDAVFMSAHKAVPADFVEKIAGCAKVGILTSPSHTPAILAQKIDPDVAVNRRFYVGERLSYCDEKLCEYSYAQVCAMAADELSVLIIVKNEEL